MWNSWASLSITIFLFLQFTVSNEQVAFPNCDFGFLFNIVITNKTYSQSEKNQCHCCNYWEYLLVVFAWQLAVGAAGPAHATASKDLSLLSQSCFIQADTNGGRHWLGKHLRWLIVNSQVTQQEFIHLLQKLCRTQTSYRPSPTLFQLPKKTLQRQRLEHTNKINRPVLYFTGLEQIFIPYQELL